jgi:hypothetical protein
MDAQVLLSVFQAWWREANEQNIKRQSDLHSIHEKCENIPRPKGWCPHCKRPETACIALKAKNMHAGVHLQISAHSVCDVRRGSHWGWVCVVERPAAEASVHAGGGAACCALMAATVHPTTSPPHVRAHTFVGRTCPSQVSPWSQPHRHLQWH